LELVFGKTKSLGPSWSAPSALRLPGPGRALDFRPIFAPKRNILGNQGGAAAVLPAGCGPTHQAAKTLTSASSYSPVVATSRKASQTDCISTKKDSLAAVSLTGTSLYVLTGSV